MASRSRYVVVVRRGEAEVFDRLEQHFGRGPDPTPVIWDRRFRDRRVIIQDTTPERRDGERRARLDAKMWTERGFVVVRVDRAADGSSAVRQARASRARRGSGSRVAD